MRAYRYTAVDQAGATCKGTLEGEDPRQVRMVLRERGLLPMTVTEAHQKEHRPLWPRRQPVTMADLATSVRQLAVLLRAGLPVPDALTAVAQHTASAHLHGVLLALRGRVLEGHGLAVAMDDFPHLFAGMLRETVAAGEHTGRLDQVLEKLADHLENSQHLRRRVMLALTYPVVVLVFAILVSLALLIFVVPQVVTVFADFRQELPWITRVVVAISHGLNHHGGLLLAILLLLAWLLARLLARESVQTWWDGQLLRLPVVARLVRGSQTARFARTFGILVHSGVPVTEGMAIASRVLTHRTMRQAAVTAHGKVREGAGLVASLAESGLFSSILLHLLASGESSGNLAEMLERAAGIEEREVETLASLLAGLVEPLMIILLGAFVLVIVLAILLPIFDLNQIIR